MPNQRKPTPRSTRRQPIFCPSDFLSFELSLTLDRINNSTAMELQRIRRLAKSAFRNPAFNPYDDLMVGFGIPKEERRQRRYPGRPEDNYHDIEPIE